MRQLSDWKIAALSPANIVQPNALSGGFNQRQEQIAAPIALTHRVGVTVKGNE
jgi:hypothetical protein